MYLIICISYDFVYILKKLSFIVDGNYEMKIEKSLIIFFLI